MDKWKTLLGAKHTMVQGMHMKCVKHAEKLSPFDRALQILLATSSKRTLNPSLFSTGVVRHGAGTVGRGTGTVGTAQERFGTVRERFGTVCWNGRTVRHSPVRERVGTVLERFQTLPPVISCTLLA